MTIIAEHHDYVVTDRGGVVETRHDVHCAVVDSTGKILLAAGDPYRITLARSAAKPAQALAISETGALEKYGFDEEDLALMCASHNSEERHLARAEAMLAKSGAEEKDLRCGGHPSIIEKVNHEWIKADIVPTAIYNNCSGKHAGMLAGAKALDAGFEGYERLDHPMQQRVKAVFEELSGLSEGSVKWAIDGCNLPAPACALHGLACVYAYFAAASGTKDANQRIQRADRIFDAMTGHPELVGGEQRFDTDLMGAFAGDLIGKVGADGCYGIGMRPCEATRKLGAAGAVGIAVKIEDGHMFMLYSAVVEILEQLDIGTSDTRAKIEQWRKHEVRNTMDIVTGQVSYQIQLRKP
ncbi:Hypothetical protein D9617_20g027090 [Elsinoe fawcettii]|nr:Hypothetical protein D9617_20g027090 [Elsinoe fawcettii]